MDNAKVTEERIRQLEAMIANLKSSQDNTELFIKSLNRDMAEVQTTLYGSAGKAGVFQRGIVAILLDVQTLASENQKAIHDLIDLINQQRRESEIVQEAIRAESDKSFDRIKRLFTLAGGIITVITLLQLIINWIISLP